MSLGGAKDEHFSCFHSSCQWGLSEKLFEIKPPLLNTSNVQNWILYLRTYRTWDPDPKKITWNEMLYNHLNFFLKVSKKDPKNLKDQNPNRKKAWIWTGITAACLHTVKTMKTKIILYSKMHQIVSKKKFGSLWKVSNAIDVTSSVLLQSISKSILAEKCLPR